MDSSGNSEQDARPCATFNKWKYKHYFVITEEGEKISELVVSYVLETRPCHVPAIPPPTSKKHLEKCSQECKARGMAR